MNSQNADLEVSSGKGDGKLLAQGTTMKSTPKMHRKSPSKYKENISSNKSRSSLRQKPRAWKSKTDKEVKKLETKMAVRIQKWWRHILDERNSLHRKIVAARLALEERKMRLIQQRVGVEKSENPDPSQDTSVCEVTPAQESQAVDMNPDEEHKAADELETACFGKFNLSSEHKLNQRYAISS